MENLVERLRTFNCGHDGQIGNDLTREAANEIERLLAALEPFAEMLNGNDHEGGWNPNYYDEQPDDFVVRSVGTIGRDYACITVGHLRAARAALKNS